MQVVDALIVGAMTVFFMLLVIAFVIVLVGGVWHFVTHRGQGPLDDKTYEWKRMTEIRARYENRDDR